MKTDNPVYYTKIEYCEYSPRGLRSILFLNTVEQQLSYQIFKQVFEAPAIIREESHEIHGMCFTDRIGRPARVVKSWKGGYRKQLLPCGDTMITEMDDGFPSYDGYESHFDWREYCFNNESYEVIHSVGINIPDEDMPELLAYCDARDFESFRGRKMDFDDEGRIGYRDEVSMHFTGITDSYIPRLVLPMDYYYDEEHIWPSEKLYRYLVKKFFPYNRKKIGLQPTYGAASIYRVRSFCT